MTTYVSDKFQINVPNQGALPGLPDDVVAELPAIIDKGGIHRIQLDPLPRKLMIEVIYPHVLSTEWEVEAFVSGDKEVLIEGLLMMYTYDHAGPTTSYAQAKALVKDIPSQHYEQEWAARYKENRPSWAHVLEKR